MHFISRMRKTCLTPKVQRACLFFSQNKAMIVGNLNLNLQEHQTHRQVVTELCGFITIVSGTFLLHATKDLDITMQNIRQLTTVPLENEQDAVSLSHPSGSMEHQIRRSMPSRVSESNREYVWSPEGNPPPVTPFLPPFLCGKASELPSVETLKCWYDAIWLLYSLSLDFAVHWALYSKFASCTIDELGGLRAGLYTLWVIFVECQPVFATSICLVWLGLLVFKLCSALFRVRKYFVAMLSWCYVSSKVGRNCSHDGLFHRLAVSAGR